MGPGSKKIYGRAGIVHRDERAAARDDLARMLPMIGYRGLDAASSACLHDGRVVLGHVRLSVVDLGAGRQLMFDHTGELLIVFNGKIYDYEERRQVLEAGGQSFYERRGLPRSAGAGPATEIK